MRECPASPRSERACPRNPSAGSKAAARKSSLIHLGHGLHLGLGELPLALLGLLPLALKERLRRRWEESGERSDVWWRKPV